MASKNSGQRDNRRRLGAIEPEVVSARGLANRVVDRMVPSGPADFDGWTGGDVSRWLTVQAESFREVRRWIGLALLVLRERSPENVYMAEVKRIATAYDVHVGTLWRWRHQAEQIFAVARVSRATGDEDVPSDDTQPREDQPADGEDPEGSTEHVSSVSPRVPGAGSTRGAEPPTVQDEGAVPDQGPGGVTLAEVASDTPQEPPPAPQSPPVAAVSEAGSPPPERTTQSREEQVHGIFKRFFESDPAAVAAMSDRDEGKARVAAARKWIDRYEMAVKGVVPYAAPERTTVTPKWKGAKK